MPVAVGFHQHVMCEEVSVPRFRRQGLAGLCACAAGSRLTVSLHAWSVEFSAKQMT